MRTYSFTFVAMGETKTEARTEFVYLLAWPDEVTLRSAWDALKAEEDKRSSA